MNARHCCQNPARWWGTSTVACSPSSETCTTSVVVSADKSCEVWLCSGIEYWNNYLTETFAADALLPWYVTARRRINSVCHNELTVCLLTLLLFQWMIAGCRNLSFASVITTPANLAAT